MHRIELSAGSLERAQKRHGRRHVFLDRLDPARTAHLIVDLQNGFMEEGALVEVPVAREIVDNVNAISAAVRAAGGLNVFLRFTADAAAPDSWASFYRAMLPEAGMEKNLATFAAGSHFWQLWPALDVQPGDLALDKTRFSAFIPGTCDLHEVLGARGIDTLIVSGTLTNCCCESTARDAMQMNYRVLFVADATAALSDELHNATLNVMCEIFGDVVTVDELTAALARPAASRAAE